jgi:hypothetical protein
MAKQQFRQAQRIKACGEVGFAEIARIATEGYGKVNEVLVDSYSASAIVAVVNALNDTNRAKLLSFPVGKVAEISFKLIK